MKEITILKPLSDLKLKEQIEDVYVYMDFNKKSIEPYYNDEVKLPLNLYKLMQKAFPNKNIKVKTFFESLKDIKIKYDKEKYPEHLIVTFYPSFK